MSTFIFGGYSLKTRVTLLTLAIFLISLWSLAFFTSQMLREDLQSLLGEQQSSTVSFIAADINQEMVDRLSALEKASARISAAHLGNRAALQAFLEDRTTLQSLFSGGVIALSPEGTAIAEVPLTAGRINVNYMDVETVANALKEGKSTIGQPLMGKRLQAPVFGMTVPIRDSQGKIVGALTGVTNLSIPNFLDEIGKGKHGKSGNLMLIAPQHRQVVISSDKASALQPLPEPGINLLMDRYAQGFEGSAVLVNPLGVKVLASTSRVPVAGWVMVVTLPTMEAFAPIGAMQRHMVLATILLSLFAAGLTWWLMKHQLAPMQAAAKAITGMAGGKQSLQPLLITHRDEIGYLVDGFNRLLKTLGQREDELRASADRLNEAQHIANLGSWMRDFSSGELSWSDEIFVLFEIDKNKLAPTHEAYLGVIHPEDRSLVHQAYADSLASRNAYEISHRLRMSDGRIKWVCQRGRTDFDAAGKPLRSHGTIQDISARHQADIKIKRLTNAYAALSRTNEAIVRCESEAALFPQICDATVRYGGLKMAWIGLLDEDSQFVRPVAFSGEGGEYLADLRISLDADDPFGQGPTASAIRENKPFWCQDFLHDPRTAARHELGVQFGWVASAALPLQRNGVTVGTFNLYAGEVDAFDEDMQKLLLEMAADISFALDGFAREAARKQADEALRTSEARSRSITESAADAIITADSAGNIVGWNPAAEHIFGYCESEVMGQAMTMLMPQRDHARHLAGLDRVRSGGAQQIIGNRIEAVGLRKDADEFALELTLARWEGAEGWFVTGTVRDITQQQAQLTQIKLAAQVFAQGREGIVVTDARRNIIMANKSFTTITGYTEAEVLGKNPSLLASGRQAREFYIAMWDEINSSGRWAGEVWNRRKDGTVYAGWLTISDLRNAKGETTHYAGNFNDLSPLKAAESRIQWLSHFDALTGLPNHTLLQDRTLHLISMAQRANESLSMMLVSIDHFTDIKEALSRQESDALLVEMAERLSRSVREQDTVSHLGGKVFVLVLPGTPASGAAHLASELLWKLAEPYDLCNQQTTLTASIGIALYPGNGSDFDSLFKAVEIAMHRAQTDGRDTFQFYSEELYQQVLARDSLTKALRHAATLDQLQLVYQPLVDLQTGQISGMEALLRWQHPELGPVPPAQFIPLAEEAGLIKSIGEWVLRRACRDIRIWLDKGFKVPHVAVNVSALQFHDNDLIAQVKSALAASQVDPSLIYLEVTEGALMDDVPRSEAMLKDLKNLGVKLSLDDFGTGYSSLSYLKRFPFDKVKIDQSFVRDITTNPSDKIIAEVIVSMAHGLGLKVIAEGVETEAQCEIMRTSVCDEIQGYFFSRPVCAQAIEDLLSEGRQLPPHLLRLQKPQRTLLLVDDEPNIVAALKRLFRRDGHIILTANSGPEGLDVLSKNRVDVIISDQRMPGMTGVEFLRAAKVNYPDTMRIVLSGYTELQSVTDAINEGAVYRFLTKPWDDQQLREHIQKAFEHKELLEENQQLDIRIRSTNQELIAANRQLGELLEKTHHQIERDETSLAIVREALQHIPTPVIGVDDKGLMAFVNAAAESLFEREGPLLGAELAYALPGIHAAIAMAAEGVPAGLLIESKRYHIRWSAMGTNSRSRGKIVTLNKDGPNS